MGRTPSVWYRKQRDAWYTKAGGRPVMLVKGKANKPAAVEAFHRLMLERGNPSPASDPPFGSIVVAWQEEQDRRVARGELSARTRDWYDMLLAGLLDALGDTPCSQLTPAAVLTWLDGHKGRGSTSRHHTVTTLRAITRWAVESGRVPTDPLVMLRKPPRRQRREHVLTPEQWPAVLAAIRSPGFRSLATFLHATGCRLGEAVQLEALHVDLAAGVAIVTRHKTARVTGKPRTIVLSPAAVDVLRPLVVAHPTGPLFRNEDGVAWTKSAVRDQIERIRERSGIGAELTAHSLRHLFATDALSRGVPVPVVSALLGHSTAATVARWYDHTSSRSDELRRAAALVRPTPDTSPVPASPSPASPPAAAPAPPAPRGTRRGRR